MLDVQTLMVATMLANALLAAILLYFWRTERTYPGFLLITGHLLLAAAGYLFLALRGTISDLLSVVAANGLLVLAIVLLVDGLMRFYNGRSATPWLYLLPVLGAVGGGLLRYAVDAPLERVYLFTVLSGALLLFAAYRVARARSAEGALPLFLAGAMVLNVVFLALRALGWTLGPVSGVLDSTPENALFQAYQLVLTVSIPVVYLLGTARRLNGELRGSREEVQSLADRYDLAITAAGMGVWDLDLAEQRLIWDARMYELCRIEPERSGDLLALWQDAIVPEDRAPVLAGIRRADETGEDFDLEFRLRRPDGETRSVHGRARAIRDPSGTGRRLVGVLFDVTAIRQVEGALREAVKKLNLLSSITRHDIQNQLTVLAGWLVLAGEQAADSPELLEILAKERRIVDRIGRQIAFTREYEDLGVRSPVWQNLGEVVARAIGEARPGDVAAGDGLDGVEVWADPMLHRVFYNLLENAARHGEHARRIAIDCREEADRLAVFVEDDGVGVPDGEKERIFERGVGKNTGFGLFMSREILALTGIGIAESGTAGRGARFELSLPRETYHAARGSPGSSASPGRELGALLGDRSGHDEQPAGTALHGHADGSSGQHDDLLHGPDDDAGSVPTT